MIDYENPTNSHHWEIPHPLLNLTELARAAIIPSNKFSVSSLQVISSHWLSTTTQGLVPLQSKIPHSLLNLTELSRAAIIPSNKFSVSSWYLPTDCPPPFRARCQPRAGNTTLPPQPHWAYQRSYNSLKQVECLKSPADIFPLTGHHYKGLGATSGQEIPQPLPNPTELTREAIIPSNKMSVSSLQLISSEWQATTTQGLVPPQGRKYPVPPKPHRATRAALIPSNKLIVSSLQLIFSH